MSPTVITGESRAGAMRRAFDASFGAVPEIDRTVTVDFLAVRLAGQDYALPLAQVAGLFTHKRITPIPARLPSLIGVAGFRGAIAPVYDLQLLLGRPRTERPDWLAVAAETQIALAFDGFDGHLRVARDAIIAAATDQRTGHVREFIHKEGLIRPIVDLPSILARIAKEASDIGTGGREGDA